MKRSSSNTKFGAEDKANLSLLSISTENASPETNKTRKTKNSKALSSSSLTVRQDKMKQAFNLFPTIKIESDLEGDSVLQTYSKLEKIE